MTLLTAVCISGERALAVADTLGNHSVDNATVEVSKLLAIPHIVAVLGGTGFMGLIERAHSFAAAAASFDQLVKSLPPFLREASGSARFQMIRARVPKDRTPPGRAALPGYDQVAKLRS